MGGCYLGGKRREWGRKGFSVVGGGREGEGKGWGSGLFKVVVEGRRGEWG